MTLEDLRSVLSCAPKFSENAAAFGGNSGRPNSRRLAAAQNPASNSAYCAVTVCYAVMADAINTACLLANADEGLTQFGITLALRQALEASALADWLLGDPDTAIEARGLAYVWENLRFETQALRSSGKPEDQSLGKNSAQRYEGLVESIAPLRSGLWGPENTERPPFRKPLVLLPPPTDLIKKADSRKRDGNDRLWVYRYLSGAHHGYTWAVFGLSTNRLDTVSASTYTYVPYPNVEGLFALAFKVSEACKASMIEGGGHWVP